MWVVTAHIQVQIPLSIMATRIRLGVVVGLEVGRMIVAGNSIRTNVKGQLMNVIMTIDALIVLDGSMDFITAGRG